HTRDSRSNNYIHQSRILRDYLKQAGSLTPQEEFEVSDANLKKLSEQMGVDYISQEITNQSKYSANWKTVASQLSQLKINQNHRRTPAEIVYDFSLQFNKTNNRGFLAVDYDWSNTCSSVGDLVGLGNADSGGVIASRWLPDAQSIYLGIVSLR
ncbi:MAG: hypothetical protein NT091_04265, partial [Candidatus Falkowbacteria bacterium]|nr:hypothetical protein [Candidatus Falkowbacteria bacterium]